MLTASIILMTVLVEGLILYLGFKYGLFPQKYKRERVRLMTDEKK